MLGVVFCGTRVHNVPMTKSEAIRVRLEPALRRKVERLAKADERSVSSVVRIAVAEYVERAASNGRKEGR